MNLNDAFLDFHMVHTDHLSSEQSISIREIALTDDVQLFDISSKSTLIVDDNIVLDAPI